MPGSWSCTGSGTRRPLRRAAPSTAATATRSPSASWPCGRTRRSAWETPGCGPGRPCRPAAPGRLDTFLGKITRNLSLDRWRALRAQKRWQGQAELALTELGDCLPGLRRRGTGGGGRRPGGEPEPLFGIPAPGETGAVCPSVLVSLLRGGAGRLERQAGGGRSPRRCSACGRTCGNTWRGRDSPYDKGTAAGCCGRYPGCVHPGGCAAARLVPQAAGIPLDRRGGGLPGADDRGLHILPVTDEHGGRSHWKRRRLCRHGGHGGGR